MTPILPEEAVKAALETWPENGTPYDASKQMRAALTAALPFLSVQVAVKKLEDAALSESVNSYAANYEFRGDNGDYTPTDGERVMIEDAIEGFLSNFLAASEPSAARELALEEILREVDEIERKVWAWSGSAFLNNELEGAEDADCKTELYSELCGIGNTMHWLRTKICALSSPDHADAGKVEGDGSAAARDVLAERRRQIEAEGWTEEHDDSHSKGEMLTAAWCYMQRHADKDMFGDNYDINKLPPPARWPWSEKWWKPSKRRRDLVKAGALILAEIERLDRLPSAPSEGAE